MKRPEQLNAYWSGMAADLLIGRTIVFAGYDENTQELFLELDNGTQILPMSDDEGNDPGALHLYNRDGNISILPRL